MPDTAVVHDSTLGAPSAQRRRALAPPDRRGLLAALQDTFAAGHGVLALVNLDHFADVNHALGQAAGDDLLEATAAGITGALHPGERVTHMGADEFAVLSASADPAELGARLHAAATRPAHVAGRIVVPAATVAVAVTHVGMTPDDALAVAETGLREAKASSRGRHVLAAGGDRRLHALRSLDLETDLRATLVAHAAGATDETSGHLLLDYQPCFDARTGQLVACEALVRWQHPRAGLLSPGQFLDVVEGRTLVEPLGRWVLNEAASQGSRWHALFGANAPQMWVNVAVAQLGPQFTGQVADILRDTDLPAHLLCLEVTERQALSSRDGARDTLQSLSEIGVELAIDDFGTGFAGMGHLRDLPATHLKVDGSYIAQLGTGERATALARAIVALGHAAGLRVVAEGVETATQRLAATELGADILQGYGLGRPMSPTALQALLGSPGTPALA